MDMPVYQFWAWLQGEDTTRFKYVQFTRVHPVQKAHSFKLRPVVKLTQAPYVRSAAPQHPIKPIPQCPKQGDAPQRHEEEPPPATRAEQEQGDCKTHSRGDTSDDWASQSGFLLARACGGWVITVIHTTLRE